MLLWCAPRAAPRFFEGQAVMCPGGLAPYHFTPQTNVQVFLDFLQIVRVEHLVANTMTGAAAATQVSARSGCSSPHSECTFGQPRSFRSLQRGLQESR